MHLPLPKVLILPALLAALLLPLPAAAAPVSLHFVDADLATVLRAAARLGGYGLVLDGAVDGLGIPGRLGLFQPGKRGAGAADPLVAGFGVILEQLALGE